jgi:acylphosphatase
MERTVAIVVKGEVQGVFYRQSTLRKANELSLCGFVKNQPDGSVYILATGQRDNIEKLISWCHEGPPRAKVESVKVSDQPAASFSSFTIER